MNYPASIRVSDFDTPMSGGGFQNSGDGGSIGYRRGDESFELCCGDATNCVSAAQTLY
jgi:hypothetical protein